LHPFFAETVVTPLLKYFDFFQILDRHYFAPRATTLEELYSCFTGGWYNLAERFTVRLSDSEDLFYYQLPDI
jgi:hypothetical protein